MCRAPAITPEHTSIDLARDRIGYEKARLFRAELEGLTTAAQDARRLAGIRYQAGATSYLEVLDSDTRLFTAEISLAQARQGELSAFVEVYRALGGGWQLEP